MPVEFNGKVVLITGAASGLGRAASIRFAQEGASLCLVDINADGLSDTVQRIGEMESGCTTFAADLGTQATCAEAVQTAIDAFGRLDVLCNIAGILRFHALHDVPPEDWNRLIATNLTAPFFMMQAAMPHLIRSEGNEIGRAHV